jgi:ribosomal protein L40E
MSNLEQELNMMYMELGKAYYEGEFEEPLPQLLPLFDKITTLKKQQKLANQKHLCPQCGNEVPENAKFCTKCGQRL